MRVISKFLALSLLFIGCGGGNNSGGGTSTPPSVPVPTALTIVQDTSPDTIVLQWKASTGIVNGYQIEGKVGLGEFQVLNPTTLIPAEITAVNLVFSSTAPDFITYTFQVRAVLGSSYSAYSNQAAYLRPLNAPSSARAFYDETRREISVNWVKNSSAADSARVERSDCDGSGTPVGNWTTISSPEPGQNFLFDSNIAESGYYAYRVANLAGATASASIQSSIPVRVPMLPPQNLTVTSYGTGFQLIWQNQSHVATQVVVRRIGGGSSEDIAILDPAIASYQDQNLSVGYYTYSVVARKTGTPFDLEAASSWITSTTAPRAGSLALIATGLNLPELQDSAIRATGTWAFLSKSPFGVLSNNDPWPAVFPSANAGSAVPLIRIDGQDRPHVVYLAIDPSSSQARILTHLWFDGSAWKSEELARGITPYPDYNKPGFTFCLDSGGMPHALLDHVIDSAPIGGSTKSLTYVHKANSVWIEESLSSVDPAMWNIDSYHLALDSMNNPHLLLRIPDGVIECIRNSTGIWNAITLPTGQVKPGWGNFLDEVWVDSNNGFVFYERSGSSDLQYDLMVLQKVGGHWETPVFLGSREHDGGGTSASAAISRDGSRIAVAYGTGSGIKTYHLLTLGWAETLVAPNRSQNPWFRLGIDGNNQLHLLFRGGGTSPYTDYHE